MDKKHSADRGDFSLYTSLAMGIIGGFLLLTMVFWGDRFTKEQGMVMLVSICICVISSVFLFFLGWMLRRGKKATQTLTN